MATCSFKEAENAQEFWLGDLVWQHEMINADEQASNPLWWLEYQFPKKEAQAPAIRTGRMCLSQLRKDANVLFLKSAELPVDMANPDAKYWSRCSRILQDMKNFYTQAIWAKYSQAEIDVAWPEYTQVLREWAKISNLTPEESSRDAKRRLMFCSMPGTKKLSPGAKGPCLLPKTSVSSDPTDIAAPE